MKTCQSCQSIVREELMAKEAYYPAGFQGKPGCERIREVCLLCKTYRPFCPDIRATDHKVIWYRLHVRSIIRAAHFQLQEVRDQAPFLIGDSPLPLTGEKANEPAIAAP